MTSNPITGLFGTQKQGGAAVQALTAAGIEDLDIEVLGQERLKETAAGNAFIPMAPTEPASSGTMAAAIKTGPSPVLLSDNYLKQLGVPMKEAAFFADAIANGAVLLAVTPDDEADAQAVRRILRLQGAMNLKEEQS